MDILKSRLEHVQSNVGEGLFCLDEIITLLLTSLRQNLDSICLADESMVPVFLLRGGLIMKSPFTQVFGDIPTGTIFPVRDAQADRHFVTIGNIPIPSKNISFILLDLIVNTGQTIVTSINALQTHLRTVPDIHYHLSVVSPFVTRRSLDLIFRTFPAIEIHTLWPDMQIGPNNRLVGINFDAGDYAFGSILEPRLQWIETEL